MKRVILALIVLCAIIAVGVLEQVYISKLYNSTKSDAVAVRLALDDGCSAATEPARKLKSEWLKKRSFLEAVTPHNETKEMVLRMAELVGYLDANDDKSALATVEIIIEMCNNTPHILGFHWEHIF